MKVESAVAEMPIDDSVEKQEFVDEKNDSADGFPKECMEPLNGLLFLGSLSKDFEYAGHDFLIETLTEGEVIKVGQLVSSHKGQFSEMEARKAYVVSACVRAVDGMRIAMPLSDSSDLIYEKYQVVSKWYPPVVDYVYRRYMELEATEFAVANALKK